MADWMISYMASDSVGPRMMWSSPDQLRGTCQRWLTANPPTGTGSGVDPRVWCDTMVRWMTEHMRDWAGQDDWNDWSMHGPMMGR